MTYDANSNMRTMTGPDGESIAMSYDAAGQVTSTTNSAGGVTTVSYTNDGRQRGVVQPNGEALTINFDAAGQDVGVNLPNGQLVQYEYDAAGRKIAVILPNGTRLDLSYDAAGQQTGGSSTGGFSSQREFDVNGRLIRQTSPDGITMRYEYDALGRTSAEINGLGSRTTFSYDEMGRLTQAVLPTGRILVSEYDDAGNRTQRSDISGGAWRYTYAPDNAPLSAIDPLGNVYTYLRNGHGRYSGTTDPMGRTTTVDYDVQGRLSARATALGFSTSYGYDANGRLNTVTDPLGRVYTTTYDAGGNVTSMTTPDGQYTTAYDDSGRPIEMTTPDGISRITYDAVGIITSRTDADGTVVNYTTEANSRPVSVGTIHGVTTRDISDGNRLQTVTDPAGGITTTTYDAAGRPIRVAYPGGLTEDHLLDPFGQSLGINFTGTAGRWTATYTRNINGQITAIEEGPRRIEYLYDAGGRLIRESRILAGVTTDTEYSYDDAGNMIGVRDSASSRLFVVDNDDRLVSDGNWTYTHDAAGRMTSRSRTGQTDLYFYDGFDRLIRVERTGTITTTITYKYHADGLLAERREGTNVVKFVWDRGLSLPQLLEERDGSGTLLRRYESDGARITRYRDGSGSLFIYALDQIDSVRAVMRPDGTIVQEYQYDAFGRPLGATPAGMGFGGAWSDPATGMSFLRTRWYQSESARFITRDSAEPDPADPTRTVNRYAYVANDPVNRIDPTGQKSTMADVMAVVNFIGFLAGAFKFYEYANLSLGTARIGGLVNAFIGALTYWPEDGVSSATSVNVSAGYGISFGFGGGFEYVALWRSKEFALFGFYGPSLTFGSTGVSPSVSRSYNTVYDTPNAPSYQGYFWSITASFAFYNFYYMHKTGKGVNFGSANATGHIAFAFSPLKPTRKEVFLDTATQSVA